MIRIDVPATSANLGAGFDSLGIALTKYNRIWMEEDDCIDISSKDDTEIPTDENNLIYWSANYLYEFCGKKLPGLRIVQENNIPMARGLGSSSACIVAGLLGANRLIGSPLPKKELIDLAARIEGHPDNTSPAISGGLVVSALEANRVYSVTVPVADRFRFALMIPPFSLKTEKARAALPTEYSRQDAVYNLSRSGLMTASLFSGDLGNLRVAVQDKIHQPYRMSLIENCEQVFRISYELGSLGTYISGAGPTICAIIAAEDSENYLFHCKKHFAEKGINGWNIEIHSVDSNGAQISVD